MDKRPTLSVPFVRFAQDDPLFSVVLWSVEVELQEDSRT